MDKNKIIDKIKKCLALAESDNPNEASAALRQAQKLMEKYGISTGEMRMADISSEKTPAARSRNLPLYLAILVGIIEKAFGVNSIQCGINHPLKGWSSSIEFIGFDTQPKIAAYAFDVLRRRLMSDRRQYLQSGHPTARNRKRKTRLADAYAEGWVTAVRKTVQAFAMPPEKKELVAQWIEQKYAAENIGEATPRLIKGFGVAELRALQAGVNDGSKVQLHQGVDPATAPAQLTHMGSQA